MVVTVIIIALIILNIITFLVYRLDKDRARRKQWRVRESILFGLAIIGGSLGAWIAMLVCRHKTKHKNFRYGIPAILFVHLIPVILLFGGGLYMLGYSLNPDGKEENDRWRKEHAFEQYPGLQDWAETMQQKGILRDTFIINHEGLRLHALYAAHPWARGTAILAHGYTDTAWSMMMLGRMYYNNLHYNILLPEHERHGLSEGEAIQMGWHDRINLEQWISVTEQVWPNKPIFLHGISMGAATVMMCSGDPLPKTVKGIIEDCGYTSVWDEFSGEIRKQFGLPVHPLMDVASWLCDLKYGWDFKEASALDQVAKSTLPMLFIHGDADTFVPTSMVYPLYDAKTQGYKKLWITEGVTHAQSYYNYPDEYLREVKDFINICLQ